MSAEIKCDNCDREIDCGEITICKRCKIEYEGTIRLCEKKIIELELKIEKLEEVK